MEKIKELERLLAENKISEAKELIQSIYSEKMTEEEKGENFVNIASIYLDLMNKIDIQYIEALKEAIAELKNLKKGEIKDRDEDALKKVRENLV